MIKRWKKLSELECVKEYGFGHKVSHFLGIHALSKCVMFLWKDVGKVDSND